jgi:hypothetical protein
MTVVAQKPPEPIRILPPDSKEFGLTQDEYEILLEDIEQAIEEGNGKYGYFVKTKVGSGAVAKAVKKSKIQEIKDRDLFLNWIWKKFDAADPALNNISQIWLKVSKYSAKCTTRAIRQTNRI